MKKMYMTLAAIAFALLMGVSVKPAMAYFTSFCKTEGSVPIILKNETVLSEPEVTNWTKHVVIKNGDQSSDTCIRVKAFSGSQYQLTYEGDGWSQGQDDYYYYDKVLKAGESSAELLIKIGNIPEDPDEKAAFNVVVIQESIVATYDEEGNLAVDWNAATIKKEDFKAE